MFIGTLASRRRARRDGPTAAVDARTFVGRIADSEMRRFKDRNGVESESERERPETERMRNKSSGEREARSAAVAKKDTRLNLLQ